MYRLLSIHLLGENSKGTCEKVTFLGLGGLKDSLAMEELTK